MGDLASLSNWFVGASVWGGLPTEGSAAVVSEVAVFKDGEELGCFVSIAGSGLVGSSCWRGLASERGVLHGEDSWFSLIFPGSPGVSAVLGGSLSSGSAACACSTFSVSAISSGVASVIS